MYYLNLFELHALLESFDVTVVSKLRCFELFNKKISNSEM